MEIPFLKNAGDSHEIGMVHNLPKNAKNKNVRYNEGNALGNETSREI